MSHEKVSRCGGGPSLLTTRWRGSHRAGRCRLRGGAGQALRLVSSSLRWIDSQVFNILLLLFFIQASFTEKSCDHTIRSVDQVEKNGTFMSKNYPDNYDDQLRCIYKFVGRPHERVYVKFVHFDVKGVPPRCLHDYVDVYTQARTESEDLLEVPLHGRYCGDDEEALPHLLVSMHNIFIIGFYTDKIRNEKGFLGTYEFVDASMYMVGTPAPPHVCGQTIRSESISKGLLYSPTYPGMYPDNIFCFYKIQGQAGQRIKFTFLDLDLYEGGTHCPFDYVKIYDGYTNQAQEIGTYCGKHKNQVLFSTSEALHIEFVTKSGRVEPSKKPYVTYWEIDQENKVMRKGFKAEFEISNKFVNLDFIKEGLHVKGTECDQRVLSEGESNGTITSPGYPGNYPLNITCHYYIDGLMDRQNLEKARLSFDIFDIPYIKEKCDNGNLDAYEQGQDIRKSPPDKQLCGHTVPPPLTASDPRLLIVFDTHGTHSGRGFRAYYNFVTDYAIPGTPATDAKCHFLYHSSSAKSGKFNSPRHPSNYPHNTVCVYEFIGQPHEQVRFTFEEFTLEDRHENCSTDYLDIFSIRNRPGGNNETLLGRYCGKKIPGPMVSEEDVSRLKAIFRSDDKEFTQGFRVLYEFIEKKPETNKCFAKSTKISGGKIQSPNYPLKYLINQTCEWHIHARSPQSRILLQFPTFAMEGSRDGGCPKAVLRIYTNYSNYPAYELCGSEAPKKTEDDVIHPPEEILSQGDFVRLRFISSARAVGAKGFSISWTEIYPSTNTYCNGFRCKVSQYCIDKSQKCNEAPNCGKGDVSDEVETECGPAYSDHGVLHVILGIVITLVLFVFILVCILHRRRKARKKKNKQEIEVRYVTRGIINAPNRVDTRDGPRTDHLLMKERTEKVSIV